jgi:hypothetical protein
VKLGLGHLELEYPLVRIDLDCIAVAQQREISVYRGPGCGLPRAAKHSFSQAFGQLQDSVKTLKMRGPEIKPALLAAARKASECVQASEHLPERAEGFEK